jgi:hypothetical protein
MELDIDLHQKARVFQLYTSIIAHLVINVNIFMIILIKVKKIQSRFWQNKLYIPSFSRFRGGAPLFVFDKNSPPSFEKKGI